MNVLEKLRKKRRVIFETIRSSPNAYNSTAPAPPVAASCPKASMPITGLRHARFTALPVGKRTTAGFWKAPWMKSCLITSTGDTDMETMELKPDVVTQVLDSMLWVMGPYLDLPSMLDYPHIVELAEAYNTLVSLIPYGFVSSYEPVEIL
jgi:hypothetical protein